METVKLNFKTKFERSFTLTLLKQLAAYCGTDEDHRPATCHIHANRDHVWAGNGFMMLVYAASNFDALPIPETGEIVFDLLRPDTIQIHDPQDVARWSDGRVGHAYRVILESARVQVPDARLQIDPRLLKKAMAPFGSVVDTFVMSVSAPEAPIHFSFEDGEILVMPMLESGSPKKNKVREDLEDTQKAAGVVLEAFKNASMSEDQRAALKNLKAML